MKFLEEELWKLGVYAKTKHNEVAPAQHELAPIYGTTNIATDHNQLMMELMKSVANRHGLACLLHEKPFAGINGSGKHNNWSISTDTHINLLEPGNTPHDDAQFLLFLVAVIKAVDEYQDLLRVSCASAGNDHRLGANEAPPAIISIFLGEELTAIIEALEVDADYKNKKKAQMEVGVTALPHFPKDKTDRNRTSPFAFTGNKFEFRMLGSSFSIAGPGIVLNTIVAEALCQFADRLEKVGKGHNSKEFKEELAKIIKETIKKHKRIIFNGDNYTEEWLHEARKRGLSNLRSTVEALPEYLSKKNVAVLTKHHVLSETEIHSRYEILMENYCKTVNIEALTMIDMVSRDIIPACVEYQNDLAKLLERKHAVGKFDETAEKGLLEKISKLTAVLVKNLNALEDIMRDAKEERDVLAQGKFYRDRVFVAMSELRVIVDELEMLVASKYWPYPTYGQMLYSVV
jgi:glutamine synthetase